MAVEMKQTNLQIRTIRIDADAEAARTNNGVRIRIAPIKC